MSIIIQCPVNSLGYGRVGYSISKALSTISEVTLHPIGNVEPALYKDLGHLDWRNKVLDVSSPCIKIWHQNDLCSFVGHGTKIGFPIFELDTFDQIEKKSLSHCDRLFVCSDWAKKVIEDNGLAITTEVIPLGIDHEVFYQDMCERDESAPYKFFTCGKWEYRKGHDKLLEVFEKAFGPDDNVELNLMCHNPFPQVDSRAWERYYMSSKLASKIKLLPRVETHREVADLMRSMDCGVYLSRAEGFNLELLESMACGLDIIYTNYSGHTEFASGRAISTSSREVAEDGVWFNGKGNWLKFDDNCMEQAVQHMRDAVKERRRNAFCGDAVTYTWENSAKKILTSL